MNVIETYEDFSILCTHLDTEAREIYENPIQMYNTEDFLHLHPTGIYSNIVSLRFRLTSLLLREEQMVRKILQEFNRLVKKGVVEGVLGPIAKIKSKEEDSIILFIRIREESVDNYLQTKKSSLHRYIKDLY